MLVIRPIHNAPNFYWEDDIIVYRCVKSGVLEMKDTSFTTALYPVLAGDRLELREILVSPEADDLLALDLLALLGCAPHDPIPVAKLPNYIEEVCRKAIFTPTPRPSLLGRLTGR